MSGLGDGHAEPHRPTVEADVRAVEVAWRAPTAEEATFARYLARSTRYWPPYSPKRKRA